MSRLKQGHRIRQVRTRCDTDTADLCGQRIREIITIEVKRCDDAVVTRSGQHLLKHGIGDHIFNHDVAAGARVLDAHPRPPVQQFAAKFLLGQLISPVSKGALCELHDVAFMNERHGRQILVNRILNGFSDQSLGPLGGYGLDADPNILRETNFSRAHFLNNEVDYFLRFFSSRLVLYACVNVFRVLSENDLIAIAGVLDWRGHALEPSYRP